MFYNPNTACVSSYHPFIKRSSFRFELFKERPSRRSIATVLWERCSRNEYPRSPKASSNPHRRANIMHVGGLLQCLHNFTISYSVGATSVADLN
jgi:hypothetical protein